MKLEQVTVRSTLLLSFRRGASIDVIEGLASSRARRADGDSRASLLGWCPDFRDHRLALLSVEALDCTIGSGVHGRHIRGHRLIGTQLGIVAEYLVGWKHFARQT